MLPRLTQSNLLERLLPVRSREASLASQHSRCKTESFSFFWVCSSSHVFFQYSLLFRTFLQLCKKSRKSGQRWKVFHDLPRLLVVIKFYFANMATRGCEGGCYYWNIQARPLMGTSQRKNISEYLFTFLPHLSFPIQLSLNSWLIGNVPTFTLCK